ncbi:MAG TPA: MFS transporter [Casimicrobiaceae bacterium]|nr:MFS transporter [Casimicrobiaceae bacterium]
MTPARLAWVALGATLALQLYTALASTAAAVLAPAIAADFGVEARWIGVFIGLVYAGAMTASLASGSFIERYGSIRVSQACVLICGVGVALMALTASPVVLVFAALVIGVGYGPITPASSQLLARTTHPDRMAMTFSIKQTGVPAGAALAGALLPSLAHAVGWRATLFIVAGAAIAIAFAAQPIQAALDTDRQRRRTLSLRTMLSPLVHLRDRTLRQVALISLAYSAAQVCLTSYLVVYLTAVLDFSLVGAGFALSVATIGGVAGRILWGIVADRWLAPRRTLALIGGMAAVCGLALAVAEPAWPVVVSLVVAGLFGATAIGWNGVQLAEVARLAPRGAVAAVQGATGFVTFSGVVAGPPLFALIASLTGSYRVSFAVVAIVSAIGAGWMASTAGEARS